MPTAIYTTYEAKTRFSEVMRKVRHGQRVTISYHGKEVAEIRPLKAAVETLGERLQNLADAGVLRAPAKPGRRWKLLARRPGALERFLADRD